jgi:hypothetical protein
MEINLIDKLVKIGGIPPARLPWEELLKRVTAIGWTTRPAQDNAHTVFYDPTKNCSPVVVGKHNYESSNNLWKAVMGTFLRCNRDLRFLFSPIFKIPENFNIKTQKLENDQIQVEETMTVPFVRIPFDKFLILFNGKWEKAADVDYNGLSVMFENGEIMKINSPIDTLKIKPMDKS